MITIEEEVNNIIHLMSSQIDYTLSIGNIILNSICGVDECWIVTWQEQIDNTILECQKDFISLFDAAQCFVEKRRYMCIGAVFEDIMMKEETNE